MSLFLLFVCPAAAEQKRYSLIDLFCLFCVQSKRNVCLSPNDDVSKMKVSPQGHVLHLFPCTVAILFYVNVLKSSRCLVE